MSSQQNEMQGRSLSRSCLGVFISRLSSSFIFISIVSLSSCGTSGSPITGRVLIDGSPMDSGTIRFQPVNDSDGRGIGGAVTAGKMQFNQKQLFLAGKYRVEAQAFKKTGRILPTDPDMPREVEEMIPLKLENSPQIIEISPGNLGNLTIEFVTEVKR